MRNASIPGRGTSKYRPEIDGLRTLAVLSVVLFHAGFEQFGGGFVGVDVFFVISGYLITSILVDQIARGELDLFNFYERRARRILPALYVTCLLSLPFAWVLLNPVDMKDYGQSLAAVAVYSSNVLFYIEADYFAPAAHLKPLLHTWSLGIEEQYYLLTPLLLAVAWRFRRGGVVAVLLTCLFASLAIAVLQTPTHPAAAFYLLPARAWELFLGALVALALRRWPKPRGGSIPGLVGLACIAWSVADYTSDTPFPSFYALLPTIGAALVIVFAWPGTIAYRLLSWKPMVLLGLSSYSIYLIHQPLFAFANIATFQTLTAWQRIGIVFLSVALSFPSRWWVEDPFRRRERIATRKFVVLAAGFSLILIGTGVAAHASHGFAYRTSAKVAWVKRVLPGYEPDNKRLFKSTASFRRYHPHPFTMSPGRHRILVVGNSHAEDLYGILSSSPGLFPEIDVALGFIQINCFAETTNPDARRKFFASRNFLEAETILVSTRWNLDTPRVCSGKGTAANDLEGLEALAVAAREHHKQLVITGPAPEFPESATTTLADDIVMRAATVGGNPKASLLTGRVNRLYFDRRNSLSSDKRRLIAFAQENGLPFLDKEDYVCDRSYHSCTELTPNGSKTMWDYAHLSSEGVRYFARRISVLDWLGAANLTTARQGALPDHGQHQAQQP